MASEDSVIRYMNDSKEALKRYKVLLSINSHSKQELFELTEIDRKFGNLQPFIRAYKDNLGIRTKDSWGSFGTRNCSCHISPPCQNCINWTNYCKDREFLCETKGEPGCVIVGHDCDVARYPA